MTDQELMFFGKRPEAVKAYNVIRSFALNLEGVYLTVHKTQISFKARRQFLCVWHPPVKSAGDTAVIVALLLSHPLDAARVFSQSQTAPGRVTCHLLLPDAQNLDEELCGLIQEAYHFACRV